MTEVGIGYGIRSRRGVLRAAGALLAGGATLPLLVACGAQTSPDSQGQGASPSGPLVELRVHGQGTSDGEGYDKNVAAFNQQFAGKYKAVHEQNTGDNYQKQETDFAGGTGADLHYAHTSNLKHQEYAVKGVARSWTATSPGQELQAERLDAPRPGRDEDRRRQALRDPHPGPGLLALPVLEQGPAAGATASPSPPRTGRSTT